VDFYFGGFRAANFGEILYDSSNETADVESTTLIQLNMTQDSAIWLNTSLPSSVPPRANAEIIWVPFSNRDSNSKCSQAYVIF
jgi:hypothetical protein